MKKISNKINYFMTFIFLFFIVISFSFGPTIYRNIRSNIYRESLSEERQANYDKMKIEYINIKNRITGTEPFNEGTVSNSNGVDVSASDNYIRTFDSIKYNIEVGIIPNTEVDGVTDASVFDGGVIKVRGRIPYQDNKPLMHFVTDAWMQNVTLSNNDTEIYAEYYVPSGTSITNANQLLSFTVSLDGYKTPVSNDNLPIFEVWMEGNKPDNNSSAAESISTQDTNELIISGKVSLDVNLKSDEDALYVAKYDEKEGRYVKFGIGMSMYQPVSTFSDLRGVEYPSGPIEVNLNASYKALNLKEEGSNYQEITSETEKSFGVLNGTFINVFDYNGSINDYYPERARVRIATLPSGKRGIGYSDIRSAFDSGNANASFSENKMTIVFDDFKINYDTFPEKVVYAINDSISPKIGYFISDVFQLFIPLYDYSEETSYDYNFSLSLNSIDYKDSSGNPLKITDGKDTNKNNNNSSISFSSRANGNFYQAVGLSHGGNGNWRDGRANALIGDEVEPSFNFYAIDGPYDFADRLISWDSSMVTLKKYNQTSWYKTTYENGGAADYITCKYGIFKEDPLNGVTTIEKLNSLNMDDFNWYDTAEEALTNGKIAAMHVHENKFGYRIRANIIPKFIVNEDTSNIGKVAVFRQYCTAQSGETTFKPYNRTYRPTKYNENGEITVGHSPSEIGESLLINGVKTSIDVSVTDEDSSGNLKKVYDVQDGEVHLKNKPRLYTGTPSDTDRIIDTVQIITTLPSGLSYKDGSSNKSPKSVIINSDGTTTITWEYNNWQINHNAPEYPEIDFTAEIAASLENNAPLNIKSIISTEEDKRDLVNHRTSNYGVVISNLAGSKVIKSIDKPILEVDESFNITNTIGNTNDDDLLNVKTLEILPTNDSGSSFHGNFTIKVKTKLPNQRIFYATNSIDSIGITKDSYGKDTIKDVDLANDSRWIEVTTDDIIPSQAVAVASLINSVEAKSEKSFSFEVIPSNNKQSDIYNFNFNATSDNFTQAIKSNTVVATVVNRQISGLIFDDANHNGVRDNSEQLVKNVKVTLYKENDNISELTSTDGTYKFEGLLSGNYKVIFSNIDDKYGIIDKDKVEDDTIDSDASYENGNIVINVSLPSISEMSGNESISLHNDLGLETSQIEINKVDSDNIPLSNAKFTIKKDGKYIDANNGMYTGLVSDKKEFTTSQDGKIIINGLPIGQYIVNETASPSGYVIDTSTYNFEVKKENGKISKNRLSIVNDINLKEVKLTVKHIFQDDESEIIPPVISTYKYNSSYETSPLPNSYKQYKLVRTDGNASGIITKNTTVTYYYQLKEAKINIKYVDALTGEEIGRSNHIDTKYSLPYDADEYERNVTIPSNYIREYTDKTDNYKGIVNSDTIDIVYSYQKKDSSLNITLNKTGTDKINTSKDKVNYKIEYKVKITDYIGPLKITLKDNLPHKIDESNSDLDGGAYNNKTITWDENINVNSYENDNITIVKNIELSYLDIDLTKDTLTNNIVSTTKTDEKTLNVSDRYNTIINVKGKINVKYIDKLTGEEISESITTVDKIGNKYSPIVKQIVGYNLISEPEKDEYEYEEEDTELIYYYERIKLKIKTKVNGTGGLIIGDEDVLYGDDSTKDKIKISANEGYVIDKIIINNKELKGYENLKSVTLDNFLKVSDNKLIEVSFKKAPQTVVNVENTSKNSSLLIIGTVLILISLIIYYSNKYRLIEKIINKES